MSIVNCELLYRKLTLIRLFEQVLLRLFSDGKLHGTVHTCLGQEATPVALATHLIPSDMVLGNHRSHGYYLAMGHPPSRLFAEIMGKSTGVCGGRGGSQHLYTQNFITNGVQGNLAPVAAGLALASALEGRSDVVVLQLGDGTLGEGAVYEAMNFAAQRRLPILFLVENNRIAQTTPVECAVAGEIWRRGAAFGMPSGEIESTDAEELSNYFDQVVERVRAEGPEFHVVHCQRFGPHSKGDDTRSKELVAEFWKCDPLALIGAKLPAETTELVKNEVEGEIARALQIAENDPDYATV